ncbi:PDDEXK family nuclease [Nocardioides scoriae]|nr:hypothetical protein [Nocardioides scoriae]
MSTLARRDTRPEIALRSELHRRGLRYRVQVTVPGNRRSSTDEELHAAGWDVVRVWEHELPEHAGDLVEDAYRQRVPSRSPTDPGGGHPQG